MGAAHLDLVSEADTQITPTTGLGSPKIAIGNTAIEALSALIADSLKGQENSNDKASIENQLEAIFMAIELDHRLQDHHAKFLERRHMRGFTAHHGGIHWIVKPESDNKNNQKLADSEETGQPGGPPIPTSCIKPLHVLNTSQHELDTL